MVILQGRLRGDVVLRASVVERGGGDDAIASSIGSEHGEHAVRVSDATAHALLAMLQLVGRGS